MVFKEYGKSGTLSFSMIPFGAENCKNRLLQLAHWSKYVVLCPE
jgi:hypothetical protein